MQQNQSAKENAGFTEKPTASATDAQKVKQEIQRDVSEGQCAIKNQLERFLIIDSLYKNLKKYLD